MNISDLCDADRRRRDNTTLVLAATLTPPVSGALITQTPEAVKDCNYYTGWDDGYRSALGQPAGNVPTIDDLKIRQLSFELHAVRSDLRSELNALLDGGRADHLVSTCSRIVARLTELDQAGAA